MVDVATTALPSLTTGDTPADMVINTSSATKRMPFWGTSFPSSPSTNHLCFRTDRGILYFYDGTRWLSVTQYVMNVTIRDTGSTTPDVATGTMFMTCPHAGQHALYVESLITTTRNTTSSTGSNYFTLQANKVTAPSTAATLGSSVSTQNDAQNSWVTRNTTINSALTTSETFFYIVKTRVGSGSADLLASLLYRLIG